MAWARMSCQIGAVGEGEAASAREQLTLMRLSMVSPEHRDGSPGFIPVRLMRSIGIACESDRFPIAAQSHRPGQEHSGKYQPDPETGRAHEPCRIELREPIDDRMGTALWPEGEGLRHGADHAVLQHGDEIRSAE